MPNFTGTTARPRLTQRLAALKAATSCRRCLCSACRLTPSQQPLSCTTRAHCQSDVACQQPAWGLTLLWQMPDQCSCMPDHLQH